MNIKLKNPLALFSVLLFTAVSHGAGSDVCAWFYNTRLSVPLPGQGTASVSIFETCLCLSGIDNFENTDGNVEALIQVTNRAQVAAGLTDLINADGEICTYPDNAEPQCLESDPCSFTCTNGYSLSQNTPADCVCEAPNVVCDGACVVPSPQCPATDPSGPSPSSGPSRRAAREKYEVRRAARQCERERMTACGVFGMGGWECVDTAVDVESCGGCMIEFGGASATGVDCTALPGVLDVSCKAGSCAVERCLPGFELLPDEKSRCVPSTGKVIEDVLAHFGAMFA